jgi:two-component system sensor kinase FixL
MAERLHFLRPSAAAAGLGLVACCFLANAMISERNKRLLAANDAQVVQAQTMLTSLEEVLAVVTEAEARERGFLITGDESYLQRYHVAVQQVPEIFERLDQLIGNDSNWKRTLASLRHGVNARIDELDAAIDLQQSNGFEAARLAVLNNNGRQLMREMRRLVDKMQGHQRALLMKWTAESRRTLRLATAADFVDMLLGIATVGLAFFLFRREWRQRERADYISRRLAAIVESSDDAIVGETLDGIIVSWNAGAERIYGYTAAEVIGQAIFMICPPAATAEAQHNLEKVRQGQRIEPFESQRVRKDGVTITVSISVSPIRDTSGTVIGASRISRDVTQQKLLQREVLEIAAREQRRIGQDLHDGTGQELTGLSMLATNLADDLTQLGLPQAAEAEKLVHRLEEALEHVRLLSKGLVPVVVDADGLMVALSDLAARTDALSSVICEFHCEEPVCIADNEVATQLFRLAQEAVTNALRHAGATRIVIALRSVGSLVTLSVADNGQGLAELLPGSNGSGLRIMRYRADLIGARFQISPNQPQGTVVTCSLAEQPMPSETFETATCELTGVAK